MYERLLENDRVSEMASEEYDPEVVRSSGSETNNLAFKAIRALLYFTWWSCPMRSLPVSKMPQCEDKWSWNIFKMVFRTAVFLCDNGVIFVFTFHCFTSHVMKYHPQYHSVCVQAIRQAAPNEKSAEFGLSVLGKFALAPHTLPTSILNTLLETMIPNGKDYFIESRPYSLAQKGSGTYSVSATLTLLGSLQTIAHVGAWTDKVYA